jgi:hypothetical protein
MSLTSYRAAPPRDFENRTYFAPGLALRKLFCEEFLRETNTTKVAQVRPQAGTRLDSIAEPR